ncbi:hypothetical protein CBR_g19410 [Chara braunii]|uniref:Uncharacterized protein n=1 Tax=Chara braunii TaxID=69332 RepID=A0A388KXW8_CHABU|nr:hypothetical protein CBR_g19410 [Chara braunii]|eukprot:GBG74897.1 hypothetical protein CBR_g19410 [Chara braunii]
MDRQQKAPIVGSPGIIVDEAPRQIVRVPGLSHQAVTRVEPESTRGSDNATWSDGRQQEGYFDCSKYGSSGGSGRVVGRVGRERGRGGSSCGIGYTSMGVRAGGVGRVTSATNSAARKVVIGRTGTSGSVAGGAPSAPATSGGGEGVSSEGAAVIPLSGLVEEPQMSTSSDPGHKPQRHQTMTKTQALGTTQVQMSSTQLQLRPQVSSAAQSEETQQPSKKAIVSQLNPTVQVFLPQSYRLAQAQAQAQAQQQTAIAAPQVRGPQQAAKPGGQQPALVASVPTAGEQCQLPQKTSSGVLGVTGPGNNTRFRTAGSGRGGSSGTRSGGSAGYQVPGGVGSVASLGVTGNSYTYSAGGATAVPGGPAVHIDRAYGPVAIPYGQSQGGLAVPAMSVAVTSSYPNQAQYAYPNSEVTWVPVITPGGAVAGGYGAPFLPLEPPGAIYFAPPAVDSVQVGSGRAGSDLVLQPPMGKAVNMHGG